MRGGGGGGDKVEDGRLDRVSTRGGGFKFPGDEKHIMQFWP